MVAAGPGSGGSIALGAALLAATTITALARGGFTARGQGLFVALCGAAVLCSAATTQHGAGRPWRAPPVLALVLLGALACASACWTIGPPGDAVRWGLVVAGYGGLAAAGAIVGRRAGPWPFAVGICLVAGVEATIGLVAVAQRALPDAERIGGAWQAGGTFEYAPALALLQIMALPAALTAMGRTRPAASLAGALVAALAAATLGVSGSAFALGVAGLLLLAMVVWPHAAGTSRPSAVAAAALVVAVAIAAHAVGGRYAPPHAVAGSTWRLLGLACVVLGAVALWLPARTLVARHGRRVLVLVVVLASIGVLAAVLVDGGGQAGAGPSTGLDHGRVHAWSAAVETWRDRPLLGAGATTYLAASRSHQGAAAILFAHNLPLELAAELGAVGLLLGVALYVACGRALWRGRGSLAVWLVGPAVAVFLVQNLIDWTWHIPGIAAAWATAVGVLVGTQQGAAGAPAERHP